MRCTSTCTDSERASPSPAEGELECPLCRRGPYTLHQCPELLPEGFAASVDEMYNAFLLQPDCKPTKDFKEEDYLCARIMACVAKRGDLGSEPIMCWDPSLCPGRNCS
jgi:hypothetical protein